MMKRTIYLTMMLILAFQTAHALPQKETVLTMDLSFYVNDSLILNDAIVEQGSVTGSEQASDYKAVLYDGKGKTLYNIFFHPGLLVVESLAGGEDRMLLREKTRLTLSFPYTDNSGKVAVYHSGMELYSFDLAGLCVPDGKCSGYENYLSCQADCGGEQKNMEYGQKDRKTGDYAPYLASILVLSILVALFLKRRRVALTASFFLRSRKK